MEEDHMSIGTPCPTERQVHAAILRPDLETETLHDVVMAIVAVSTAAQAEVGVVWEINGSKHREQRPPASLAEVAGPAISNIRLVFADSCSCIWLTPRSRRARHRLAPPLWRHGRDDARRPVLD